jgi:hypothetical protein
LVYRTQDREFIRQRPTDDVPAGEFDERAAACMSVRLYDRNGRQRSGGNLDDLTAELDALAAHRRSDGLESSLVVSHERTDPQRDAIPARSC